MNSLSLAWFARQGWGLLLVIIALSGCAVRDMVPGSGPVPEQELQALFTQPYIDPLTDYLKQHRHDAGRRSALDTVMAERDRRCRQIAQRYAARDKTVAVLTRYRTGYGYSCPEQVDAFAAQVGQAKSAAPKQADVSVTTAPSEPAVVPDRGPQPDKAAANECYLLAQIHNHADAIAACSVPARDGDLRAQRALAESLAVLQQFAEARGWLLKAAQQQDVQAQIRLAEMYLKGQAGEANPAIAWAWYYQAGDQTRAASLAGRLNARQRQQALQEVQKQLGAGH